MNDCREKGYLDVYFNQYPSNESLINIANYFIDFVGVPATLEIVVGDMLRKAIDEVIDMPRTGRFDIEELEKTEKTYIGTKVEIILRDTFKLTKGKKLDLLVNGVEVDVKNTIQNTWTIPTEAVNEICLLVQSDDKKSVFSFGLIICRDQVLNKGKNRDQKRTISANGKKEILWIVKNGALPKNFFLHMDPLLRDEIFKPKAGAKRLANLFRNCQGEYISRNLVECVAQQKDYMKRVRGNGGARDILKKEGLLVLWGGKDQAKLKKLGFNNATEEHFICVKDKDA